MMHHEVGIQWPDQTLENRNIDFVVYGDPKGYSAMAATVGFPTGIATKMVLEGMCSDCLVVDVIIHCSQFY